MAISSNTTGLRPGVCTSTSRPSSPYEGQMIYETDTDLTYIWGGSAWQQVSGGTAIGNSGLVFVKSQTIGSAVPNVTVTDAFSATYDNYLIRIAGMTGTAAADTTLQLGGITTGVYISSGFYQLLGSSTINPYTTTGSTMPIGTMGTTQNTLITIDISAPNLAVTKYAQMNSASATLRANQGTQIGSSIQATAFTIAPSVGTISGGTITVYGYRK